MRYAFFPGCVSRGGCPELYPAATTICQRLGIGIQEMPGASCTGAGVLQEKNQLLGDALNARTFAMAEQLGLPILTICSTCQGVMSQANRRLKQSPEYLAEINSHLAEEGLEYRGTTDIKHLLWVLVEDYGLDELTKAITRPLHGVRMAPFYGCYIIRPSDALDFEGHPERQTSLGAAHRDVGGDGGRLFREDPLLRLPDSNHQRKEFHGDGGQAHGRREGPGSGRDGHSLPAVPPEPGRLPAQGGGPGGTEDRDADTAPAPGHRPCLWASSRKTWG